MKRTRRRGRRKQTRAKHSDLAHMILINETYVNRSKGYISGDSGVYETGFDSVTDLFRRCQREYGRCTGKVYIDTAEGPRQTGWAFEKKDRYEDTGEPFLMETWVDLHESMPESLRTTSCIYSFSRFHIEDDAEKKVSKCAEIDEATRIGSYLTPQPSL